MLQKNLSINQLLLIGLVTVLFLLAAFALYLLQDLSAPLPFEPPSPTSTRTPLPTITRTPTATSTPTHRTSYTPFAHTATPGTGTPSALPATSVTASLTPGTTVSPTTPAVTSTGSPVSTPTRTITSTRSPTTPTITATLAPGEVGVTGRVVRNGVAVAGVVVAFKDDEAPRLATTDANGHYWFITYAPGTSFTLTFYQVNNSQLTPASEIASTAWIEGALPTGTNPIQLPDLEVSINLNGMMFELQEPADGNSYSAAAISSSNPLQFNWTSYYQAVSYYVELGASGSDQVLWTSNQVVPTNLMWDGTLDNASHITSGTYWWRVAAGTNLGPYLFISYTQDWSIIFTP